MQDTTLHRLTEQLAQAQALCAILGRVETAPEPETLRDYSAALCDLLERAQNAAIDLIDCEVIPIRSPEQLQRVQALRAELEAMA